MILDLSRARGIFESPYLVMEILSVPSISIEVLELANRQILKEYHGVRHISELLNEISPSF